VEWGWPRSSFRHVPNFVDTVHLQPRYTPGDAFVYVGRLSREKGLFTVVRAAAAAKVRLVLAGTGPQQDELKALAAELKADVTFLGFLTGEPLHDAIRTSRAVVLASEWYENAPLSILEAYAFGKPVIGARIGGIPELIRENETGLAFTSGSPESLAEAMRTMLGYPDSRVEEMGRAGRQWVEQDFTAARYMERVLNIYREFGVDDTKLAGQVRGDAQAG
jgi:glycosyltransferase involved in cell wall biosynthesis